MKIEIEEREVINDLEWMLRNAKASQIKSQTRDRLNQLKGALMIVIKYNLVNESVLQIYEKAAGII